MSDSAIYAILERLLPPKLSDEDGNFVNGKFFINFNCNLLFFNLNLI